VWLILVQAAPANHVERNQHAYQHDYREDAKPADSRALPRPPSRHMAPPSSVRSAAQQYSRTSGPPVAAAGIPSRSRLTGTFGGIVPVQAVWEGPVIRSGGKRGADNERRDAPVTHASLHSSGCAACRHRFRRQALPARKALRGYPAASALMRSRAWAATGRVAAVEFIQ
jgi:hypothetical protein